MTLADAVGWPRVAFVERMNQKATELGMTGTRFTEPTGLDEGNVSTPSDVAILLTEALRQSDIQTAVLKKEHTIYSKERDKTEHMWSTDWLLLGWIPETFADFRGGKTGFIEASGYNFAMEAGDGHERLLDVVVLGAETHEARFTEARDIAEWVQKSYRWPDMVSTTVQ
jgi:D-alanyl-D-alanine carboxypeptidase